MKTAGKAHCGWSSCAGEAYGEEEGACDGKTYEEVHACEKMALSERIGEKMALSERIGEKMALSERIGEKMALSERIFWNERIFLNERKMKTSSSCDGI